MRILLLTHGFNSLTQRLYAELAARGHELSVEFDINDATTQEAAELYEPDIILAPYLRRAIPASVWRRFCCLIVHPGPPGDRGPSALDWAVLRGETHWGVTVLQAEAELDAGPVWASASFPLRPASKASLYRNEVTQAAVAAVLQALERYQAGENPQAAPTSAEKGWQPLLKQAQRRIDWQADDTDTVLRKIRSGDGYPGVADTLLGLPCRLYNAQRESQLGGEPGAVLAQRDGAICRATRDGAVWIGQLKLDGPEQLKLPATVALGELASTIAVSPAPPWEVPADGTLREINYAEKGPVGYLSFEFNNGAMSSAQCERLRSAYAWARTRPTRVLALLGGADFWSNGMHLHCIEAAASPADESWRNINAIDDLAADILQTGTQLTVAALRGNAAAGGVFLALAADRVFARAGVVLNPHYRNMGNLYGSEYWTYVLPRRLGDAGATALMQERLPLLADQAAERGLIDGCAGPDRECFDAYLDEQLQTLAADPQFARLLADKNARRQSDEARQPLASYRARELERMRLNFYGFDPSYHVARHRFVQRTPLAWTPRYLARHRQLPTRAEPGPALAAG